MQTSYVGKYFMLKNKSIVISDFQTDKDDSKKHQSLSNDLPSYQIFEVQGDKFLCDVSSGQFILIDEPTYEFLQLYFTHPFEEAKGILLKRGRFSSETIESVSREISLLKEAGFFKGSTYSLGKEEIERQLNQCYLAPWNKIELSLSEICNLACKYCYCGTCRDIIPSKGLMTESVTRQAITWLFAMSGRSESVHITLFGGEPLFNKPMFRFAINYSQRLAKLHNKKVTYSMTTNGTLLDDEVIEFIKEYNFGLMVSLDGPQARHDAQCPTRSGQGSFEMAVAGIKRLMTQRKSVTVRCTMAHPFPRMMDLIKFFEDFGFTRIVLGRASNVSYPSLVDCTAADFLESERQEREEILPWILQKLTIGEKPKYFPYESFFQKQPTNNQSLFKCGACRGTSCVGADGTLYPCHRFMGMKNWQFGNILDGIDYDRCKQFWRDYKECISKKCDSCWMRVYCKGPCPWEIARLDGSFALVDKTCEQAEYIIKRAASLHAQIQKLEDKSGIQKIFNTNRKKHFSKTTMNNTDQPNDELTRRSFIARVAKLIALAPLVHFTILSAHAKEEPPPPPPLPSGGGEEGGPPESGCLLLIDPGETGEGELPPPENCTSMGVNDYPDSSCAPFTSVEDFDGPPDVDPPHCWSLDLGDYSPELPDFPE